MGKFHNETTYNTDLPKKREQTSIWGQKGKTRNVQILELTLSSTNPNICVMIIVIIILKVFEISNDEIQLYG